MRFIIFPIFSFLWSSHLIIGYLLVINYDPKNNFGLKSSPNNRKKIKKITYIPFKFSTRGRVHFGAETCLKEFRSTCLIFFALLVHQNWRTFQHQQWTPTYLTLNGMYVKSRYRQTRPDSKSKIFRRNSPCEVRFDD